MDRSERFSIFEHLLRARRMVSQAVAAGVMGKVMERAKRMAEQYYLKTS